MPEAIGEIKTRLLEENAADPQYASRVVERLLQAGIDAGASDLHLQPTASGLQVNWRIDGVLQPVVQLPAAARATVVARLKVLADLLTYRTDTPQEGRLRRGEGAVEMRVSTFPTLYGEKIVVRLFAPTAGQLTELSDLGLPTELHARLRQLLAETSGAILICGPAGAGKTTTAYAALRAIVARTGGGRSIATLEDPIEAVLEGVAQAQVQAASGFDFPCGLRSLMRQDPEVILVGEIRDRVTAEIAFQAALTGQLLLTTFHASSAAGALSRLADMGIPPYVLRSGVLALIAQRLVRRLCDCARPGQSELERCGFEVGGFRVPVGCEACRGTGYRGRLVIAEILLPDSPEIGAAILAQREVAVLQQLAESAGMLSLARQARHAIERGDTSPAEVRRVLGFAATSPEL